MVRRSQSRSAVLRARSGFAVFDGAQPRVIKRGALIAGDDPLAASHAHHFEPVENRIEQATATPGERRSIRPSAGADGPDNQEEPVPHTLPPEDPNSPASPFAPLQPGAGVVADDVPDEQNPAGGPKASDAPVADLDSPAVSTANVEDPSAAADTGKGTGKGSSSTSKSGK